MNSVTEYLLLGSDVFLVLFLLRIYFKLGDLEQHSAYIQSLLTRKETKNVEDNLNDRLIDLQRMKFSKYPLRKDNL